MKRVLASAVIAVAAAGVLAACMPRGDPLTPEQARVVQANLVKMEAQVTRQLRETLEQRGIRRATAEEVVARLTGNTTSMSGGGGAFVTYYLPDGTIKVQLTTLKGEYRSDGRWTVDDDGIRCVTVDELRKRRGYDYYADQLYSGLYDGQLYSGPMGHGARDQLLRGLFRRPDRVLVPGERAAPPRQRGIRHRPGARVLPVAGPGEGQERPAPADTSRAGRYTAGFGKQGGR